MTPRPPLNELLALFRSTVAREGITTGAGAATGDSIIDAGLIGIGADSFVSMLLVVYPGDFNNVESFDVTAFNTATGEITLNHAYKEVAAAIPAGVPYKIVTFRFVPAEVAALLADVGNASASTLGSLYAILGNPEVSLSYSMGHIPKFTGEQWFVSKLGNDANSGTNPDDAFLTIVFAVSAAAVGDRIKVMAGVYDEADLDLNLDGLELVCEQGTVINHTVTPGTVLIVSADYCVVSGVILSQAGQTGLQVTGNFCLIDHTLAFGCATGFDDNGLETHMMDCRSIQHTTTGFAIAGSFGWRERLIAIGAGGAVRGIYLDVDTADSNHFRNCHTLGNATAGWEVIAGADNNVFSSCSTGGGDGAKVDAGTNNTWTNFSEGSQIVAGQTRDQDLKDIYDLIVAINSSFQEQPDVAVDITAINAGETDVFDLNVAATRYIVRSLRLKCVDPGANTITVRLYELVNDASLEVDSFEITTANFGDYHSLMDMFGQPHLAGDDLQVTVRASAAGPYAVTGQYSHATG